MAELDTRTAPLRGGEGADAKGRTPPVTGFDAESWETFSFASLVPIAAQGSGGTLRGCRQTSPSTTPAGRAAACAMAVRQRNAALAAPAGALSRGYEQRYATLRGSRLTCWRGRFTKVLVATFWASSLRWAGFLPSMISSSPEPASVPGFWAARELGGFQSGALRLLPDQLSLDLLQGDRVVGAAGLGEY